MVKAEWSNGVKSSAGRQLMAGCQVIGLGKTSEVVNNTDCNFEPLYRMLGKGCDSIYLDRDRCCGRRSSLGLLLSSTNSRIYSLTGSIIR